MGHLPIPALMHFRLSTSCDTVLLILLTATALLLLHFHSMTLHCYYTWEARNCIVVSSKNLGPNPFCIWWRCQPALTENSGAFFGANLRSIKSKLVYKHVILYKPNHASAREDFVSDLSWSFMMESICNCDKPQPWNSEVCLHREGTGCNQPFRALCQSLPTVAPVKRRGNGPW